MTFQHYHKYTGVAEMLTYVDSRQDPSMRPRSFTIN